MARDYQRFQHFHFLPTVLDCLKKDEVGFPIRTGVDDLHPLWFQAILPASREQIHHTIGTIDERGPAAILEQIKACLQNIRQSAFDLVSGNGFQGIGIDTASAGKSVGRIAHQQVELL